MWLVHPLPGWAGDGAGPDTSDPAVGQVPVAKASIRGNVRTWMLQRVSQGMAAFSRSASITNMSGKKTSEGK